jgi:tRNA pseudouridine38-40 synthase
MNILCKTQYDGSDFHGWQIQPDVNTVQETIETALSKLFDKKIKIIVAGRTDAGVHAICNCFNFKIDNLQVPLYKLHLVINNYLPGSIRILESIKVNDKFHARYSAVERTYRYYFNVSDIVCPFKRKYMLFLKNKPDFILIKTAMKKLLGEHDFSGFRASDCCAENPVRNITNITIFQDIKQNYVFEISANAFLKNMVRRIFGTLLEIGYKKKDVDVINEIIENKDSSLNGKTVEAQGLYLYEVVYPE